MINLTFNLGHGGSRRRAGSRELDASTALGALQANHLKFSFAKKGWSWGLAHHLENIKLGLYHMPKKVFFIKL